MDGTSRYNQPVKSYETLRDVYNKSLGQGDGYGMQTPRKSPAKMRKIPIKNSSMPQSSAAFAIDEKLKSTTVIEQPIILNNIQENSIGLSVSTLSLNNKKKSVNQVLSRL